MCASPTSPDGYSPEQFDFMVVANRLPVDRVVLADGSVEWRTSPGGLVSALHPVMRGVDGAWIGWSGASGPEGTAEPPSDTMGLRLLSLSLTDEEVENYYGGFANSTLWPLYHDVIVPPQFHRHWWNAYVRVNDLFAGAAARHAAPGATVWVHDYQLQLVPGMIRRLRRDLRIGFFNHIPFPGYEIFAQLPWRRQIVEGLLGADLVGFQRQQDASNFLRACRRAANLQTRGTLIHVLAQMDPDGPGRPGPSSATRDVRAAAFPISIDFAELDELSRRADIQLRSAEIREALGRPKVLILGVDRLDYTKGIRHRLQAYGELLDEGRLGPPDTVLVQVASPSRERVDHYRALRDEVETTVGRINGDHSSLGSPAVHYLHRSFPRDEMIAMYLAADVMLVTPLRDGMNLVAKEYVACRSDDTGRLVLSEFTGSAEELAGAFATNPHDIEGMKESLLHAIAVSDREAQRRMRTMRRRVRDYDVNRWASSFLGALDMVHPDASYDKAGDMR